MYVYLYVYIYIYIYIHFTSKLRKPPVSARVSVFFMVPGFPDSGFLFSSPFSWRKNIESASQTLLTKKDAHNGFSSRCINHLFD